MKWLVLGGSGYLADGIVDVLAVAGHDITVYDNLLYQDYYLKPVPFIYGDIRDQEKLSKLLPQFDGIILLAGLVGDAACQIFPEKTIEINTAAPKWIFDNFSGRIVFMSTCSVYGKNDDMLDEKSPTNPLSLYASSKLDAERYLFEKRPDALCFRLGTVYGSSGAHSRPRLDLVGNILTVRATLRQTLKVFGHKQFRPLINCLNVADAVACGIKHEIQGLYVLSEKNYTLGEIAEEIVNIIPGSKIEHNELSSTDMRNYKVDSAKWTALGWVPKYSFKDGILAVKELVQSGRIKDCDNPLYHNGRYIERLGDI